jgi:hypothetical protein
MEAAGSEEALSYDANLEQALLASSTKVRVLALRHLQQQLQHRSKSRAPWAQSTR